MTEFKLKSVTFHLFVQNKTVFHSCVHVYQLYQITDKDTPILSQIAVQAIQYFKKSEYSRQNVEYRHCIQKSVG